MPTYKLIYFQSRGKAEASRFIFKQAGVEFEDIRIPREKWPEHKPNTPYGTLPVLEVDGKQLSGTGSIQRYLAETFGLAGSNAWENAQLDSIVGVCFDLGEELMKFYFESDKAVQAQKKEKLEQELLPKYLGILEKVIKTNNSAEGWVFGSTVTYADFMVYNYIAAVKLGFATAVNDYPGIQKNCAAVKALPNIAKWLKERPESSH